MYLLRDKQDSDCFSKHRVLQLGVSWAALQFHDHFFTQSGITMEVDLGKELGGISLLLVTTSESVHGVNVAVLWAVPA